MNLFSELAFSVQMQILLFFINLAVTTLSYYWGANLILYAFQMTASIRSKVSFSLLSATLLNILMVYGISLLNGLVTGVSLFHIGKFQNWLVSVFPTAYLVLYITGVRILKLPPYKSVLMMKFSYLYFLCCHTCNKVYSRVFIKTTQTDSQHWNYLIDIQKLLGGMVLIFIVYRSLMYIIKKTQVGVIIPDNITVFNIRKLLLINLLECTGFYLFLTSFNFYSGLDSMHFVLLLILLLGYLFLGITREVNKIQRQMIINNNEHITALTNANEDFRSIKHDFNNILQTYSGFLCLNAYDDLQKYHSKVVGTTINTENYLDICARYPENPTFFSLLVSKLEYAKKQMSISIAELYVI